jgi:hypothetical protein
MLTAADQADLLEIFGFTPEQLDPAVFREKLRDLRLRFHPDQFEKFGDETVRQMATERFQRIERLAEKVDAWLKTPAAAAVAAAPDDEHPMARYAYDGLKIEIRTSDKDLKYQLFGTFYRWLTLGERFKIPGAKTASLIADEGHVGHRIGYTEGIRLYLTFGPDDSPTQIVEWFFTRIAGRADTVLIEGEPVAVEYGALLRAIRTKTMLLGD